MTTQTDITNLHTKLPADVRLAVETLATFVDGVAVQPGTRTDPVRFAVHSLVAALNKLA